MSYLNKRNYIEVEHHHQPLGVEGIFTCRAIKPGFGVVRELSFKNLITDLGLDSLAANTRFERMHLGTGTAAPANGDTALGAFGVSVVNTGPAGGNSYQGTPPRYRFRIFTWTSSVGGATGTWTEIGISNQNTNGNLRSRALIVDNLGNPTSFPVLADEQFQGTYEFRLYLPDDDHPDTITIAGVDYDTITRMFEVDASQFTLDSMANAVGQGLFEQNSTYGYGDAHTGDLAAVTGSPSGYIGSATGTLSSYSSGNYYRDMQEKFGSGIAVGNIRTITSTFKPVGFQTRLDPVIAKLSTEELIYNHRVSWARR